MTDHAIRVEFLHIVEVAWLLCSFLFCDSVRWKRKHRWCKGSVKRLPYKANELVLLRRTFCDDIDSRVFGNVSDHRYCRIQCQQCLQCLWITVFTEIADSVLQQKKAWGSLWFSIFLECIGIFFIIMEMHDTIRHSYIDNRECVHCSFPSVLHIKDLQWKTHGGRSVSAGAAEGAVLLLLLLLLPLFMPDLTDVLFDLPAPPNTYPAVSTNWQGNLCMNTNTSIGKNPKLVSPPP